MKLVAATHLDTSSSFACLLLKSSLKLYSNRTKIMLLGLIYSLLACFSCGLLAKAVGHVNDPTPESHRRDLRLPSQPSGLLHTFNATSSASMPNDMSIRCNGNEYGFKPDVEDCTNALDRQMIGRTKIKFGQRGSISSERFVHLPYRLMGGT